MSEGMKVGNLLQIIFGNGLALKVVKTLEFFNIKIDVDLIITLLGKLVM